MHTLFSFATETCRFYCSGGEIDIVRFVIWVTNNCEEYNKSKSIYNSNSLTDLLTTFARGLAKMNDTEVNAQKQTSTEIIPIP